MFDVIGSQVPVGWFGTLPLLRSLCDYDGGSMSFVTRLPGGLMETWAHQCDWDDGPPPVIRYAVKPLTDARLAALEAGDITLREAMGREVYLVDVAADGKPCRAWHVRTADIPAANLPTLDARFRENGGQTA